MIGWLSLLARAAAPEIDAAPVAPAPVPGPAPVAPAAPAELLPVPPADPLQVEVPVEAPPVEVAPVEVPVEAPPVEVAPVPAPAPPPRPVPLSAPEPSTLDTGHTGSVDTAADTGDTGLVAELPPPAEPARPGLSDLLPAPAPRTGLGAALSLLAVALALAGTAGAARVARGSLREHGALPAVAGATEGLARAGVGFAGVGALLALVPDSLLPAVPFVAIAVALAVGWSARDALPDLVAFWFLAAEGRLRPGLWVKGDGFGGRIEQLGARATWIVDPRGGRTAVPNRMLLGLPVATDTSRHPEVAVTLVLAGVPAASARAALHEAALISPWIAPGAAAEVGADPAQPDRWTVRIRLVDGRFEDRFAGTFPERVSESLAARRT